MHITVIGHGAGAQALAAMWSPHHQVTLLALSAHRVHPDTTVHWPDQQVTHLKTVRITTEPQQAIASAEVLVLCHPMNRYPDILTMVAQHLTKKTQFIAAIPGAVGFDWMVRQAFAGHAHAVHIGATESLPFIAQSDGDTVRVHVFKQQLYGALAHTQGYDSSPEMDLWQSLLPVTIQPVQHFLSLTLLHPNAKVHPLLFLQALHHHDQPQHGVLSPTHARMLDLIEAETATIQSQIALQTGLLLDEIPRLQRWFTESYPDCITDQRNASSCLASHTIYQQLTPQIEFEHGNTTCRWVTEDIPYGLVALKGLAHLVDVNTPTIDQVIEQCQTYLPHRYLQQGQLLTSSLQQTAAPQRFGIKLLSKLSRCYQTASPKHELEAQEFNQHGITFLGTVLTDEQNQTIQQTVTEYARKIKHVERTQDYVLNLHWKDERFARFCSLPALVQIACRLLQVPSVQIFSSLILVKPPESSMPVPWHQDPGYRWPLEPVDCASLWLALDDVYLDNGAMTMTLGGHQVGYIPMQPTFKQPNDQHFSPEFVQSITEDSLSDFQKIICDMKRYECSFHHSMMPHMSPPNGSQNRRGALIVRYCRGDARLNLHPGMTRAEFFKDFRLFNPHQIKEHTHDSAAHTDA